MKKIVSYSAGAFLALALALTPALAIVDATPPSAPGSLTATAISAGQINLAWTAATDDVAVAAYIIFRNGSPVGFATTNAFSDTGLAATTAYSYTVKALDTSGNYSPYSNTATATTLAATTDTIAPSAPSALSASAISDRQINLIWTASTDNVGVTAYQIFRNGSPIGTSSTTSFSDTGLTANTPYTYTVKALDAAGNVSAESAPTSTATLASNYKNRGHHDEDGDEDEDDDEDEEEYESEGPNGHEHWHIHGHGQGHAYGLSKNKHHDDD